MVREAEHQGPSINRVPAAASFGLSASLWLLPELFAAAYIPSTYIKVM